MILISMAQTVTLDLQLGICVICQPEGCYKGPIHFGRNFVEILHLRINKAGNEIALHVVIN